MFSATKGGSPSGYQISRSVRLRSSASAYLSRTPASAGNRQTWTWSGWVKLGSLSTTLNLMYAYSADSDSGLCQLSFQSNQLRIQGFTASFLMVSTPVYRDPSAWYHIVYKVDTTQATAANRVRVYINGVEITAWATNTPPPQNTDTAINNNVAHNIGRNTRNSNDYLDGYITELNLIDGQALDPSSFGETNPVTGVWQPKKYAGTYGTNGFYLNFSDNSAATAAAIGADYSGNGNDWTPNNISVTAGVTYDSMLDVPTLWADGGNGRGNYCTGNPLIMYNGGGGAPIVPKNGNLDLIGGAGFAMVGSTIAVSTGKWYWEATFFKPGSGDGILGIHKSNTTLFQIVGYSGDPNGYGYGANGSKFNNTTGAAYGATFANGDVIGVALDLDAGTLTFYKNNTSQGVAFSSLSGEFFPAFSSETAYFQANFGQRPFAYTPPTGFKALNTLNLPTPTILKGNQYFDATLYTGTGSARSVTGVGFQPDWVWIKARNVGYSNRLVDVLRGVGKELASDSTIAELTNDANGYVSAFNADGFSFPGGGVGVNGTGVTYVAWNWKANGAGVSNGDGTITSTVSANTTAGISIVTYTGTGVAGTVGHGLGVAPSMIISKNRSAVENWRVAHIGLTNMASWHCNLDTTQAQTNSGAAVWNNTTPTSNIFGVGTDTSVSGNGNLIVAYCFAEVPGYSKFGSYTGNGSADGPFVYLGFRPAFVLVKQSSSSGNNWVIYDTARDTYNECDSILYTNLNNAEFSGTTVNLDILSNGFKPRDNWGGNNQSGSTYIYAAFAEHPFKNALAR